MLVVLNRGRGMHLLGNSVHEAIFARARQCTSVKVAECEAEKAIHPIEKAIWEERRDALMLEMAKMRADECRIKEVARERWDNSTKGSDSEYAWALRYVELANPMLKETIFECHDLEIALRKYNAADKSDPSAAVWLHRVQVLKQKAETIKANACESADAAAAEFVSNESDSSLAKIWLMRYITLKYQPS